MLAFSGASFAEEGAVTANVTNGKNIFENGKGDSVPACATCHGDKAMGNDAMGSPRLANVGYVYIVKQLTNFAEDKRTRPDDAADEWYRKRTDCAGQA